MAHAMLGRKLGMTQVFEDGGRTTPVTVIKLGPCVVTAVKTDEAGSQDGYNAVQIAFEEVPERKITRPELGVFSAKGVKPHRFLREFRVADADEAKGFEPGQVLDVSSFSEVSFVDVSGTTKGRGFAGVMKRWGFKGAKEASHGTHEAFRHGGAIGASAYPSRVHKNKRMAGQYGNDTRTAMSLRVVKIMPEQGFILVKGSVPGPTHGVVFVRPAVKRS